VTIKVEYESRTRFAVAEISAALGLAGLATMKGGA
jgi:hypothetical protein